jgi:hypothetical protein
LARLAISISERSPARLMAWRTDMQRLIDLMGTPFSTSPPSLLSVAVSEHHA